MSSFLTPEQIHSYQNDGYLIIKDFAEVAIIEKMKLTAADIIQDFDLSTVRIFTTEDQTQHMDKYFLESGDKVRCFFEEGALDEKFNLTTEKKLAINKIGHALHDLVPIFKSYSYQKAMLQIVKDLGMNQPAIAQSQYIFKQPKIGAKVNPHTDSTFIYTDPLSCVGAWLALEDATMENGCLSAEPGSHLQYPLQERFVRNSENTGTEFESTQGERHEWDSQKLIPLEVKKGDLVLLHGEVVHASYANRSSKSRHAYIIHLIDLNCSWSERNWLQRSEEFPFRAMQEVI